MSGTVLHTLETGSLFFIKPWEKKVTLVKTTAAPMRPTITFQVKNNSNNPRSEYVQSQD